MWKLGCVADRVAVVVAAGLLLAAWMVADGLLLIAADADASVEAGGNDDLGAPSPTAQSDPILTTATATATAPGTPQPTAVPAPTPTPTATPDPAPTALLTFRGNATRTFHGTGPIGHDPMIEWHYPQRAMCADSTVGEETKQWCGTGWTGQPSVFVRDGRTWVVVGTYDRGLHFIDGHTGEAIIPPFRTGDLIKGSVTIDPDGYPIAWVGSRDGHYRAIAFDGDAPRELFSISAADATGPTLWNNDWDGAGLVIDDHLVIGGENSRLFVAALDRGYDADGMVTLDAAVIADVPGWDDELLTALGDRNVSIENSVAIHDGIVYFANSGGLVQGWSLQSLTEGDEPERTFRFWTGDDTDATIVIDDETGHLFVASEWERHTARSREIGQMMRLDPSRPDDPLVWGVHDPRAQAGAQIAGAWATPALWEDLALVAMTDGTFYGLDAETGDERWTFDLGDHLWSSPVVIDDVLLQGDCAGNINAYDLHRDADPEHRWTFHLGGGCVESTPAVLDGRLYVGTRAGQIVAVALTP